MPSPVDRLKIESVGYPEAAARANRGHVLGLRGRRGRRFQLGYRVQVLRLLLLRVRLRMQMGMMVVM